MTWFAIIFSTLTVGLLTLLMYVMPSITQSTLPLGVSVPQDRVGDPAIADSVRKYRVGIIASLVVSLAITVMLGTMVPTAGVIAPVLVFLALSIGSYVAARSSITKAKREGSGTRMFRCGSPPMSQPRGRSRRFPSGGTSAPSSRSSSPRESA